MTAYSVGLLILRVVLGVTMAAHGYNKFFGGGRIKGTAGWFESLGMKPGKLHAYLAACTELACGLGFAAGLLTPLTAAGGVGILTVATWTHKGTFFIFKDGWEYNMVLAVVTVGIAITGPGRYSLDHALDIVIDPWPAFFLSAVLGLAAGAALLIFLWKPDQKPSDA